MFEQNLVNLVQMNVLNLSKQLIQLSDIPAIISFLNQHPHINKVDFSENEMNDEIFCTFIRGNKMAVELDLKHNNLTDEGIFDFVKNNTVVTKVNLSWNRVGESGIQALANSSRILELIANGNAFDNPLRIQVTEKVARRKRDYDMWLRFSQLACFVSYHSHDALLDLNILTITTAYLDLVTMDNKKEHQFASDMMKTALFKSQMTFFQAQSKLTADIKSDEHKLDENFKRLD